MQWPWTRQRGAATALQQRQADVCLLVEGAYPYVAGGVSTWVHDLIKTQRHLTFHLVTLMPQPRGLTARYELPSNVLSLSHVYLAQLPTGAARLSRGKHRFGELEEIVLGLQQGGQRGELTALMTWIDETGTGELGQRILLESQDAWDLLLRMYNRSLPHASFSNYFWSWRSMLSSLFATLLAPIPDARLYHSLSTGYSGLLAARAKFLTRRPVLLTEHGIYTNERRVELMQAQWLAGGTAFNLSLREGPLELKDLWSGLFASYARACYAACDRIITLYTGNQVLQLRDGAAPEKLQIIPNGISFSRYARLAAQRQPHPPTIALIGRVVPIKDVKTFIHAANRLRGEIPELRAWILGPTEEDPTYFQECKDLVSELGCTETVDFKGRVKLEEFLSQLDVVVLTSLSEAQPLVILEAGAAAVPMVSTDVGACREMIMGQPQESPALGPGGAVTGLASAQATADALAKLLHDPTYRERCGRNLQKRVEQHYNKTRIDEQYRRLYQTLLKPSTASASSAGDQPWPG
jgi:glycosyltransferase involved in cell wall biosynthesis